MYFVIVIQQEKVNISLAEHSWWHVNNQEVYNLIFNKFASWNYKLQLKHRRQEDKE